jgi:hypothetical protein
VHGAAVSVFARQRVQTCPRATVMPAHQLEVGRAASLTEQRQQRRDRVLDGADERYVDADAPADVFAAGIDLHDARVLGEERPIGEVGPEHEQCVAVLHRPIAGGESEQARHAHIVWVVVLDELLPAHRVHNWRCEPLGDGDQLVMGALAAGPGEDGDAVGGIQQIRCRAKCAVLGRDD